jgi:hypothetical protein
MLPYVIVAIGTLWGLLTLIGLREEEKEIQELFESVRNVTRQSHGSE